ncbi:hypothetical protein DFJ74DRAFT_702570 [Hyaloraphidium curvatum]|nr:hypothetical protein DFJ74DRAFT_702570 [Hyaloraphidium curvatum]
MKLKPVDKDTRNGILSVFAFVAVVIALVVPLGVTVRKEANPGERSLNVEGESDTDYCGGDGCIIKGWGIPTTSGLIASARIVSIDPVLGNLRMRFDWYPSGTFLRPGSVTRLARNVTITVGNQAAASHREGSTIPFSEAGTLLFNGDVLEYPFDIHYSSIYLHATTTAVDGQQEVVPIGLTLSGGAATYSLAPSFGVYEIYGVDDPDTIEFMLQISRSTTTKFFAIVLGIVMWGLALTQAAIVLDKFFFRPARKIELGQLGVATGLLFALPGIRSAMPSAPPVGTVLDSATFFWAEVIVAVCAISQLWGWMLGWSAPKKEDKKEDKKDEAKPAPAPTSGKDADVPVSSWVTFEAGNNGVLGQQK